MGYHLEQYNVFCRMGYHLEQYNVFCRICYHLEQYCYISKKKNNLNY